MTRYIAMLIALTSVPAAASCGGKGGEADAAGDEAGDAPEIDGDGADPDPEPDGDAAAEDPAGEGECTSDLDCDDSDPCTVDACDTDYGTCGHAPVDEDGDGYPAAEVGAATCPGGTDCMDDLATAFPGAPAIACSALDNDCNGRADLDDDGDGHEDAACGGDDCDDADPAAHPGGAPGCSGTADLDCNGDPDLDNDGDGHGAALAPDSTPCGGDDCDDTDPTIHPGADDGCLDGVDRDCDTVADGPMVAAPSDLHVSFGAGPTRGSRGDLAWTGTSFLAVYDSDWMTTGTQQDMWAYGITPSGSGIIPPSAKIVSDAELDFKPRIAWGTSFLGVAWIREQSPGGPVAVSLVHLDQDLVNQAQSQMGPDGSTEAAVAFGASGFMVCWEEPTFLFDRNIGCRKASESGTVLSAPATIASALDTELTPDVAWSGSEFGLVWATENMGTGFGNTFLMLLDEDMAPLLPGAVNVSAGTDIESFAPAIAWAGSAWAVTWSETEDSSSFDAMLNMVSPSGVPSIASARPCEVEGASALMQAAWTGSALGVVWTDTRDPANWEIYFRLLDGTGAPISSEVRVTNAAEPSQEPMIVWTGSEFGLLWQDERAFAPRMYFNRISLCD